MFSLPSRPFRHSRPLLFKGTEAERASLQLMLSIFLVAFAAPQCDGAVVVRPAVTMPPLPTSRLSESATRDYTPPATLFSGLQCVTLSSSRLQSESAAQGYKPHGRDVRRRHQLAVIASGDPQTRFCSVSDSPFQPLTNYRLRASFRQLRDLPKSQERNCFSRSPLFFFRVRSVARRAPLATSKLSLLCRRTSPAIQPYYDLSDLGQCIAAFLPPKIPSLSRLRAFPCRRTPVNIEKAVALRRKMRAMKLIPQVTGFTPGSLMTLRGHSTTFAPGKATATVAFLGAAMRGLRLFLGPAITLWLQNHQTSILAITYIARYAPFQYFADLCIYHKNQASGTRF
eukprot:GHVT01090218.1.p1 GENE.GHVT01090218.1~~GHVT01090218.1.p1  ORF type:complete len:341 (+),score=10.32 GHVT01090218.1:118-1140(+)